MSEKVLDRVSATVSFSNGQIGHKEAGDEFEYDLRGDPLGLKAEGKVVKVQAATTK